MTTLTTEQVTGLELAVLSAHWIALWLGLHLLSRRPRSGAGTLVACACMTLSAYLLATASAMAPDPLPARELWGALLGGWVALSPALLMHAFLRLTDSRLPHQRAILTLVYAFAVAVCILALNTWRIFSWVPYAIPADDPLVVGPYYWVIATQIPVEAALALFVLVHARLRPSPSTPRVQPLLDLLIAGMSLLLAASVLMQTNTYFGGSAIVEALYYPILGLGCLLVVGSFARYPSLIQGQLLRTDLKSSLLGAALLLAAFTALVLAAGASFRVLAGLGWLVLAVYVFADDIHALVDRVFFGAGSRSGRTGLRIAASYVGSRHALDVSTLTPQEARSVAGYMSELDRAGVAAARLGGVGDPRLELLERDEFGPVRDALGLAPSWAPADGLSAAEAYRHVATGLEPRERQALGLKYLGYSDKEMARLMGVKVGVPRSYLGEGKRKLGFAAGAQLMLFVHFSDLVGRDAAPLLLARQREEQHRGPGAD